MAKRLGFIVWSVFGRCAKGQPTGRDRGTRFLARLRFGISGSTRFHSSLDTSHDLMALISHFYHGRFFNVNNYLRISS